MKDLRTDILEWLNGGAQSFDDLVLRVFCHQYDNNLPYRNYCEALGINPRSLTDSMDIPCLPTDAFKETQLPLRSYPAEKDIGYFLTSGTTRDIRGRHNFRSLELYRASVLGAWRELGLPAVESPFYFSQSAEDAPHSSLVKMFEILDQENEATWLIDGEGNMTAPAEDLSRASCLLSTSAALLSACDSMPPTPLPAGSWILETGGSKGLRENLTPEEVHQRLSDHFSVPLEDIFNEYSMTELFSQFYRRGNELEHYGPPWTAIRILDVHSGKPATRGAVGYLEIIDLANLDSLSFIRTQDLAIATGERSFQLLGRDPEASARGCSRGVDALLQS